MKKILVGIGVLLVLAIIPITIFLVKQGQEVRTRATPATVLSLTPPSLRVSPDDSFDIFVNINTGENLAMGVDLKISFDPSLLEAISVEDKGFFTSPQILMNKIDNDAGLISYSVGSFAGAQGTGNIIAISFKAKSSGTASIVFAQGTAASAADEFDILERTIPASIVISGNVGNNDRSIGGADFLTTPTPSPVPSITITPTPSLVLTSTPTATPTSIVSGTDDIPVTGISLPTIFGLAVGLFFLIFSFVLI